MTANPDTQSEVEDDDARFWLVEIDAAKERMSDWYKKAEEAEDRYRDCEQRKFGQLNLLWANVETQKAAIGEDFGKPQVTRVNQPANDGGLSRQIAQIWERTLAAAVRDDNDNHDIALAVYDLFVPGRGQVWLELEAEQDDEENIKWVRAPLVRVPYEQYLEGFSTRWGGVPWVARQHLFTKDELIAECGISEEQADTVPMNVQLPYKERKDQPSHAKGKEQFKRAAVWEIWTKFPKRERIYVAESHDIILCRDDDPYRLKNFFPCPRPLLANGEEGYQEPLTDYSRYEDQAKELDEISARIFVHTSNLRRRGVHDKKFKEIADLAEAADNVTLAVDNWVELQAKGGLPTVMQWEDLQPTITVLAELHKQRSELIELIYQLTGISDLARGMTDPNETAAAQKMKRTFGSGRFQHREKEARRFAAEAYAIKGEVIAEHFPREQLAEMSGIALPTQKEIGLARQQLQQIMQIQQQAQQARQQLQQLQQAQQQPQPQPGQPPQQGAPSPAPAQPLPNPQQIAQLQQLAQMLPPDPDQMRELTTIAQTPFAWEKIARVLKSDYRRCYSVEVETDQSNFVDEEADKSARIQLLGMINQMVQQSGPLIAANPANGEFIKKIIMFVISSFKSGRAIEEDLEHVLDNMIKQAAQSQGQQQPDPKAQLAQINLQIANTKLQHEQVKMQSTVANAGADSQQKVQDQQLNMQQALLKQQEAQNKAFSSAQTAKQKADENQRSLIEGEQKIAQQHMANEAKRQGHLVDLQNKAETLQFDRTERATAREEILRDTHANETKRQAAVNAAQKKVPAA